jgi:hypothetical protein
VDWALAQRGEADMGSLQIVTYMQAGGAASAAKANEWLRYAMRHVPGSLHILVPIRGRDTEIGPMIELPSHGRATSIELGLRDRGVRLPEAAEKRYEALTDLTLDAAWYVEDEGRGLGDFLSFCCPRLRRLRVDRHPLGSWPAGVKVPPWLRLRQLVLRVEALAELGICLAPDLWKLDVTAPNLRVLRLKSFLAVPPPGLGSDATVVRISAPRLQEIHISDDDDLGGRRAVFDVHDATSVRRLTGLRLHMHGQYCLHTDAGFWLLENCTGVESVEVCLHNCDNNARNLTMDDLVDLTAVDGATPLANVSSMTVRTISIPDIHLVASVSSLLLRCPRLRSLRVKIGQTAPVKLLPLQQHCPQNCGTSLLSQVHY